MSCRSFQNWERVLVCHVNNCSSSLFLLITRTLPEPNSSNSIAAFCRRASLPFASATAALLLPHSATAALGPTADWTASRCTPLPAAADLHSSSYSSDQFVNLKPRLPFRRVIGQMLLTWYSFHHQSSFVISWNYKYLSSMSGLAQSSVWKRLPRLRWNPSKL